MCKEVDGLCLKLHYCTPGLLRTSAESTPYKGATSPIPLEHLLLLLLLLLLLFVFAFMHGIYTTATNYAAGVYILQLFFGHKIRDN